MDQKHGQITAVYLTNQVDRLSFLLTLEGLAKFARWARAWWVPSWKGVRVVGE